MSMHHEVGITCPKCQKAGVFTVWDSINTKLDPDMKDRVKSLEAFRYHCGHCGTDVQVDYGFLYHDMDHHFMVFYAPTDKDQENADRDMADGQDKFKDMVETAGYVFRLVRRKADVLAKLAIFEAGRDDRLMEWTTAAALAQVGEKDKDFTVTESHFGTADDGSLRLNLIDGTMASRPMSTLPTVWASSMASLKRTLPPTCRQKMPSWPASTRDGLSSS